MRRILIVGLGALGGTLATRALCSGIPVDLAVRTAASAQALRLSGLRVFGVGGAASAISVPVAAIEEYRQAEPFDLIVLATKAREALEIAPFLQGLLAPEGTLLPLQNGGVSQVLDDQLGGGVVLGGLSNLGATLSAPGVYEQRNDGHLLVGELAGGASARAERVARTLSGAIATRATPRLRNAVWAKLLLNCSVTTIGAVAGQTMRGYMERHSGREVFRRIYGEALSVAEASGNPPERMIVEPIPPGWRGAALSGKDYDGWIGQVLAAYGDLKASMWQDIERGRRTEIDFINGYVAGLGRRMGVPVGMNEAMTALVHRIEEGGVGPGPARLDDLLRQA
jgi:2-dehydropantoate 2-reductase